MLQPGDCSPSRSVVSNIVTCFPCCKTASHENFNVQIDFSCRNEKGHHPFWMMTLFRVLTRLRVLWLHHPPHLGGASTRPEMAVLRASRSSRTSRAFVLADKDRI